MSAIETIKGFLSELNSFAHELNKAEAASRGSGHLLPAEADVLGVLEDYGSRTVPQIARMRSTSRQNVQVLVNRLASANCIELIPNPRHQRSPLVRLTAHGLMLLVAHKEQQSPFLNYISGQLAGDELQSMLAAVRRTRAIVAGYPSEKRPARTRPARAAGRPIRPPRRAGTPSEPQAAGTPPPVIADEEPAENTLPVSLL